MSQIKILFTDIDSTLTETISGKPFKQSPDDIRPINGAQAAIKRYHEMGYQIFGISNQGGCGVVNPETNEPYKTIDSAILEMQNTLVLFPEIEKILFCPSAPELFGSLVCIVSKDGSSQRLNGHALKIENSFRKPDLGMVSAIFRMVSQQHDHLIIQTDNCLFVGDRNEDKECAESAGIPFMWANEWVYSSLPSK